LPEGTDLGIPSINLASDYAEKEGDMAIAAGYGIYKNQCNVLKYFKSIYRIFYCYFFYDRKNVNSYNITKMMI
jgi:hypothetical protein